MSKVNLIFGTYNQLDPSLSQDELEKVYEDSYKPFLSLMNEQKSSRFVCYYSSPLLKWLNQYHRESIILLKELIQSNRLELLVAGFYEPLLSYLSPKDRAAQYEDSFTLQRNLFGKKFHGGFLPYNLWEPAYGYSLKKNSINYIFISADIFYHYGFPLDQLNQIFITEDQGEILYVIPILDFMLDYFIRTPNDSIIKELLKRSSAQSSPSLFTLFFDGSLLGKKGSVYQNIFLSNKFENFLSSISENRSLFKTELVHSCFKSQYHFQKVYFGNYHDSKFNFKMYPNSVEPLLNTAMVQMSDNGMGQYLEKGHFRQFLSKYYEANKLYSKTTYVTRLLTQYKSDKQRKMAAEEDLKQAQMGYPYLHAENHPGIYLNSCRKAIYSHLLDAEKVLREKGTFSTNIIRTDFNMDGIDEFLFSSHNFNAYIDSQKGEIFELDYFPTRMNYLDTMIRYPEYYHEESESQIYDHCPANSFCDFLFSKDCNIESFLSLPKITEKFIHLENPYYRVDNFDSEKRVVSFSQKGIISQNGTNINLSLHKKFNFGKNITVSYMIQNLSKENINFKFASLLNFSFDNENSFILYKTKEDSENLLPLDTSRSNRSVQSLSIEDLNRATFINFFSDKNFNVSVQNVVTKVKINNQDKDIFQHLSILPIWNVSIRPERSWNLTLNLGLAKK